MAISIEDIKKLRAMTGAGLADVKKALTEAEGDFDKAKELLRERGLAIAAKRSDRETSNGCVLVKKEGNFAAMIGNCIHLRFLHCPRISRIWKRIPEEQKLLRLSQPVFLQ